MFDATWLPTTEAQYRFLRAWGKNELRAVGYVGELLARVEAALWAQSREIASVHLHGSAAEAYERLVRVAVAGRCGDARQG